MTILSSREHSCVHPVVSKGKNKNEECKKLLDGSVVCRNLFLPAYNKHIDRKLTVEICNKSSNPSLCMPIKCVKSPSQYRNISGQEQLFNATKSF